MPICKNNKNKTYTGEEPSPKGLGYCASGEKEGKEMKGKDGNMWIKINGKWIKESPYKKILHKKLYKWWQKLAEGQIIIIYDDDKHTITNSNMKTRKAQLKEIIQKWKESNEDKNVKAIIWSAQSTDAIDQFIDFIIKRKTKFNLDEIIKLKNLPSYLVDNYKLFFKKYEFYGKKDYTLRW